MAATTTVQNILDAAWQILKDPSGALFYPAADMYRWVNEGVEQIRQARPECQITHYDHPGHGTRQCDIY